MKIKFLAAAFAFAACFSSAARADVLDDIIEFYDPALATAKQAVFCHVYENHPLAQCITQYGAQAASQDADFANILEVARAVRDDDYPLVLARVGLGAACAWIDVPQEDVVCGDFGGAIAQAGAAAISTGAVLVSDVGGALASMGGAVYDAANCLFGQCGGGGGNSVTVDAVIAWNTCFAPRINEGVRARLGSASAWARLTDERGDANGFAPGSLQADCSNASVLAHNPAHRAWLATTIQSAFAPMHVRYREIVEQAAAASLGEAADDYQRLQSTWMLRAGMRSAAIFLSEPAATGPVEGGERNACIAALNQDDAVALGRWASANGDPNSAAGPFNRGNWNAGSPQVWCMQTFAPALHAAIEVRRNAYQQALAAGCTLIENDPVRLRCAALGAGLQRCRTAFDHIEGNHCSLIPITVRVTTVNSGAAAPPASAPPENAATITPRLRVLNPVRTSPPSDRAVPPAETPVTNETPEAAPEAEQPALIFRPPPR